jgi:membrane fusion protein, multidrug efflux system
MKTSRVVAIAFVASAILWIVSGYFLPRDSSEGQAALRPGEVKMQPPFHVEVMSAKVVAHSPTLILSGHTEADHKVALSARTGGLLNELRVKRGQHVKKGDVIAVLADEAREAQVLQAEALVDQRKAELEAKRTLIASGTLPRLDLGNLEAQYKSAQATLATARAEHERSIVRAPWDGVITSVPAEVGGAAFSFSGTEIATLVALDPMLAVGEVPERKLAGVTVGQRADIHLVTNQTVMGRVRYVAPSASPATRTYRVEVVVPNPDGVIPDGITSEIIVSLQPIPATRLLRSALTISSAGEIGVRIVDSSSKVVFEPVQVVEDLQDTMWVSGVSNGARVIVRGQDFVRDGQIVAAVDVGNEGASR